MYVGTLQLCVWCLNVLMGIPPEANGDKDASPHALWYWLHLL